MIEINGKVYRNLQEQVEKNAEDIQDRYDKDEIAALLYGKVDKSDIGYIEVTSTNGDLTDEQYAECSKKYCILCSVSSNQKTYYYKYNQTSSTFLFKRFPTTNGGYDNYVYFTDAYFTVDSNKHYSRNLFDYNLQKELVSGTNIKTINNESLLGSGNISVQPTLVSGTNIKTINNESILGEGNISITPGSEIGILNMGVNTDTEGELSNTQLSYLTENTVSLVIKNGLYYYRAGSSYNLYIYRSLPEVTYNLNGTTTQTYKLFLVNTNSKEWWDYERSFTTETPVYEYAVSMEFNKTGTGAGYYTVYFTLRSTTNYYNTQDIDFTALRNMIIANGNNVVCSCHTSSTLNMNSVSTSENAGDPTILIDSRTSDFYEFYSLSELTNYSITKLNY